MSRVLHDALEQAAQDVPALGDLDRAIRTGVSRRRWHAGLLATGVAAAAVVVVVVLSTVTRPDAAPVQPVTPSPSRPHATPVPAPTGPFDVVVVRGTRLVALDSTGAERWSRDLKGSGLKPADLPYAYVSSAGWLSVEGGGSPTSTAGSYMSLLNLADPSAEPRTISGYFDVRAWSPDGRLMACLYAAPGENAGPAVIDPASGTVQVNKGLSFPGGGPDPAWTADSTGLLWESSEATPGSLKYLVAPVDGSMLQKEIPDLWFRDRRLVGVGGRWIAWDKTDAQTLVVHENDGATGVWYDHDLPQTVVDTSLTADAQGAWLLLKGAGASPTLTLARTDATRSTHVISTTPVDSNEWNFFGALAPDDSMVIAESVTNPNAKIPTSAEYLLRTDGSPGMTLDGGFVGWVPDSVVEQLP